MNFGQCKGRGLRWHAPGAARAALACASLTVYAAANANGPAFSGLFANANTAQDASYNPAALTRIKDPEWMGDVVGFSTHSTDVVTATVGPVTGSTSVENSGGMAIPGLYYARPWNERIGLGVSLSVPSGVGSDPGDATIGRYLLEQWSLGYVSLAPAVGYRVNEKFSVGVAAAVNYSLYDYKTAVFNGPGQADGTMELKGGAFGFGYRLGLLYELSPQTRLALAYRSSTSSSFDGTPDLSGLTPQREQVLQAAGVRNANVNMTTRFPQMLGVGAYHEFANGASVSFDGGWIDFAQFGLTEFSLNNNSIQTPSGKYKDIWAGTGGLNWPLNERWTARFGAAYVSSGVNNENRNFALRLDRIWGIGAGAEYRWGKDKSIAADLNYYNLGPAPVTASVPGIGSLSAEYSSNYAIGLHITFRWQNLRDG